MVGFDALERGFAIYQVGEHSWKSFFALAHGLDAAEDWPNGFLHVVGGIVHWTVGDGQQAF